MEVKREELIEYSYYDEEGKLITIVNREKLAKLLEADEVRWKE
jgi:hypothetical protein|nr:MAG TPA: PB1 PB1 domain [Caudoviricetes sp.]